MHTTHTNTLQNSMECVKIFVLRTLDDAMLQRIERSSCIGRHQFQSYTITTDWKEKCQNKRCVMFMCALHPWLFLAIPFSDFGFNSREISRKTREKYTHTHSQKSTNRNIEAAAVNIRAGHHMLFSRIGSLNHIARSHSHTHFFLSILSPRSTVECSDDEDECA